MCVSVRFTVKVTLSIRRLLKKQLLREKLLLLRGESPTGFLDTLLQGLRRKRRVIDADAVALDWVCLAAKRRRDSLNRFFRGAAVHRRQVSTQGD